MLILNYVNNSLTAKDFVGYPFWDPSRQPRIVYAFVYFCAYFTKILVNHIIYVLWTLKDTKKAVYGFSLRFFDASTMVMF